MKSASGNVSHFTASAKDSTGVDAAFMAIAKSMSEHNKASKRKDTDMVSTRNKETEIVLENPKSEESEDKCSC